MAFTSLATIAGAGGAGGAGRVGVGAGGADTALAIEDSLSVGDLFGPVAAAEESDLTGSAAAVGGALVAATFAAGAAGGGAGGAMGALVAGAGTDPTDAAKGIAGS